MNSTSDIQTPTPQVLVVDDQSFLREMMYLVLQNEGYQVNVAANGEDTIAAITAAQLAGRPIPLILLDMVMPVVDGIEVLQWLDDHPQVCGSTRVIVITGTDVEHLAEKHPVLQLPFVVGRFRKPVPVRELIVLVRSLLTPESSG